MSTASKPDLGGLSDQLAADNVRVDAFINSLPGYVDRLVDVATAKDWQGVRRLSEYLAMTSESCGLVKLNQRALDLAEQSQEPDNETAIRRGVVRVIGACGSVRPSDAMAPGSDQ